VVAVEDRERRASLRRAEIGEDEARELHGRIRTLPDALLEPAAARLAGSLEAPPVDVEGPAVIAAADAAIERDAELERRPAVRAMQVQDADPPAAVTEHDEVLTEDAHPEWPLEVSHERHRLPEPAQVLAARRAGPDLSQLGVRWRNGSAPIAIEGLVHERGLSPTPSPMSMICSRRSRLDTSVDDLTRHGPREMHGALSAATHRGGP